MTDSWWHSMLILPPLFKDSLASPFLSAYYPDCVGMSPSASSNTQRCAAQPHGEFSRSASDVQRQLTLIHSFCLCVSVCVVSGLSPCFQPFYQPNECGKALCVRPDMMELDELYEFPEFSRDPTMYLALRNLVLAAWHRDCKVAAHTCACPHAVDHRFHFRDFRFLFQ